MNKTINRNKPISGLIKNYIDKKSGKVTESRTEIRRRFYGLDWKDQKKIMSAFLESSMSDRQWAYVKLLDLWDESFKKKVLKLWNTYHEEKCAWVIIRHFPVKFIKENIEQFSYDRDYYFICRRLSTDPNFIIEKDKLSNIDYLMAMAHSKKHIDDEEATETLFSIVREVCFNYCPIIELSKKCLTDRDETILASDFNKISIALYYLMKMGNHNVVIYFQEWEKNVQESVCNSKEYMTLKRQPLSIYEFKDQLATIVQKYLYHALQVKFKTITDEEFDFGKVEPF